MSTMGAPSLQEGYQWLTADAAAHYLGLGRNHVRMLIRTGAIQSITIGTGRQRRTTKSWCDAYIQSRMTMAATSEVPPTLSYRPAVDHESPQVRQAQAILNQHYERRSQRFTPRKESRP